VHERELKQTLITFYCNSLVLISIDIMFFNSEPDQNYRDPMSVLRDPYFQRALMTVVVVDVAFCVWALLYSTYFSYSSARTLRAIYKQRNYHAETQSTATSRSMMMVSSNHRTQEQHGEELDIEAIKFATHTVHSEASEDIETEEYDDDGDIEDNDVDVDDESGHPLGRHSRSLTSMLVDTSGPLHNKSPENSTVDASQHSHASSPFVEMLSHIAVHQRYPTL
jgi:hypothetical protein